MYRNSMILILFSMFVSHLNAADADKGHAKEIDPMDAQNRTRVSLEGAYFWDEQFPLLNIHFAREGHDTQTLHVRFPEMIEANDATSNRRLKFYQDNRMTAWPVELACEPLDTAPEWEGDDRALGFTMAFDNGMTLTSRARVEGTRVILTHVLDNATLLNLHSLAMWNCVQLAPAPEFEDKLMERTNVPVAGRALSVREGCSGFEPYTIEESGLHRILAYTRQGTPRRFEQPRTTFPHPGFPDDPDQAIVFLQVDPTVDRASITTLSRDGSWAVTTHSDEACAVWSNPGITCHHADADVASCPAGETGSVVTIVDFHPCVRDKE